MPRFTSRAELAEAVLTASRVLVGVSARSLAAHENDVSLPQYRALVVLAARGAQRPGDLAEALGIDASSATRLCDRLARKGLITRKRRGPDRREVQVDLTAKSRALLHDVTARRRAEIERILAAVPAGERAKLVHAFDEFSSAAGETPDAQWPRSWVL